VATQIPDLLSSGLGDVDVRVIVRVRPLPATNASTLATVEQQQNPQTTKTNAANTKPLTTIDYTYYTPLFCSFTEMFKKLKNRVAPNNGGDDAPDDESHNDDGDAEKKEGLVARAKAGAAAASASLTATADRTMERVDVKTAVAKEQLSKVGDKLSDGASSLISVPDALRDKYNELERRVRSEYDGKLLTMRRKLESKFESVLDTKVQPMLVNQVVHPDQPRFVQKANARAVHFVWPDIKEELYAAYVNRDLKGDMEPIPEGQYPPPCWNPFALFRAWFLYTLYPNDRTVWRQRKTISYWLLTAAAAVPLWGVQPIFFTLELALRDKRDEFQLADYILGFKKMQFITLFIISSLLGMVQYYQCVSHETAGPLVDVATRSVPAAQQQATRDALRSGYVHSCDVDGPGQDDGLVIEMIAFVAQLLLVWVAYLMLPYSTKKGHRKLKKDAAPRHYALMQDLQGHVSNGMCCKSYGGRGGWLRWFMVYDVICAVIVVGLGVYAMSTRIYKLTENGWDEGDQWHWMARADLFYLRVVYGAFAAPFLLFALPGTSKLLLHLVPTAYNRSGDCLPCHDPVDTSETQAFVKEYMGHLDERDKEDGKREATRNTSANVLNDNPV
jgi:hypothetical protein